MPTEQNNWKVGDIREIEHQFTDEDVAHFAELSGDQNPLHMDDAYAKSTLAGGRVVHGMLGASFVSTLIGMSVPGPGALWNRFSIQWRKMIRIGDTLKIKAEVSDVIKSANSLTLKISAMREHELIFDADANVMMMDPKQEVTETTKVDQVKKLGSNKKEKAILIIGATGAIGSSIAKTLAAQGFHLILWGRNEEGLAKLSKELGKSVVLSDIVDVAMDDQLGAAFEKILNKQMLQSIIYTIAAPWRPVSIAIEENIREMELHWKVGVQTFAKVCTRLQGNLDKGGSILAVSTNTTMDIPPDQSSAYVSSKMALNGYVKSLAFELGPKGIRANVVSPSMLNTNYIKDVSVRKKMVEAARNPMRRLCEPEDIARTVAFLVSNDAAFINGANIPITGGVSMP